MLTPHAQACSASFGVTIRYKLAFEKVDRNISEQICDEESNSISGNLNFV